MAQLHAYAPAFGVLVRMRPRTVFLQASDSAGRGKPDFAALVGVTERHGQLRFACNTQPTDSVASLQTQGLLIRKVRNEQSPYEFEIAHEQWPASTCALLLLGYRQPRGIGGDARPRLKKFSVDEGRANVSSSIADAEVAEAVRMAVATNTIQELRTGLIRGTPAAAAAEFERGGFDQPVTVTFAHASCQYPSGILDHMPDDEHALWGPADSSLLRLGEVLQGNDAPTLLLLAGDQIYVDATAGLFDPKTKDAIRASYERRGRSRGVSATMQQLALRVEETLDDHEIRDNWEPDDEPAHEAKDQYFCYQRAAFRPQLPRKVWRSLRHQGLPFFLGDTRTDREGRTALNWRGRHIMRWPQRRSLYKWLSSSRNATLPKFLLTASAFLPRQLNVARDPIAAIHSDAWDGYPRSQEDILKFIFDNNVRGLVFLSGDQHISSFTRAIVTKKGSDAQCVLHSIHSSGLYSPYPFANNTPNDFPQHEIFTFAAGEAVYSCEVFTSFTDKRDGFAVVTATPTGRDWELATTFWASDGPKREPDRVTLSM